MSEEVLREKYKPIKEWAEDDRPREKFFLKGKKALSTAELLAILLGSGSPYESAVKLGRRMLDTVENDLNKLARYSLEDLCQFKGIGQAKAITILAALELGRRKKASEINKKSIVISSRDVFEMMAPELSDLDHEEFWFLLLNRSNRVLSKEQLSKGGLSQTTVDVRIILKKALAHAASGIILCHNHPSDSLKPSQSDQAITQKIKEAAQLLDIALLDHVIFSQKNYFSFSDNGTL